MWFAILWCHRSKCVLLGAVRRGGVTEVGGSPQQRPIGSMIASHENSPCELRTDEVVSPRSSGMLVSQGALTFHREKSSLSSAVRHAPRLCACRRRSIMSHRYGWFPSLHHLSVQGFSGEFLHLLRLVALGASQATKATRCKRSSFDGWRHGHLGATR